MERLVEVIFTDNYTRTWVNILNKEELDQLQSICSRQIEATQLSKRHVDKGDTYLYSDEDKNHEDAKILVDKYSIKGLNNIVPLNQLLSLPFKVEFKISNTIKEYPEYQIENNLLHKLMQLEEKLNIFTPETQFNCKVGVHISDLGLLSVKYVTYEEDCCTDVVQGYLDDGWRILAVCPQPDKRRPDYIFGRNDQVEKTTKKCR